MIVKPADSAPHTLMSRDKYSGHKYSTGDF